MKINNSEYGGFVVSKNIVSGVPIRYSFREKSSIQQLNGWNLYSMNDDDEYVNNSNNFVILSAESISKVAPVVLEIFDAPYGTDLCWLYEEGVHIGFYDLAADRETTIDEILKND
ncbi:DUF2185 domain-containing protein [Clostridium sp. HBUAS56017]|uniref:DUF2185 domain-containing protein n=1 Tax=Clostridium sp. HBUAS56017 TaxID=2571128 RepID=UPI001178AEEC|nr:DUF2185 domain-containing protein [Clostridium sp. HBUAS56017]